MNLIASLRGLVGLNHGPKRTVELDLVQQWALLTLQQHGDCTFRRLQQEIDAIRGASPAEVVIGLVKLERDGVVVRGSPDAGGGQTSVYRLTRDGHRVARLLPVAPRSAINVYL